MEEQAKIEYENIKNYFKFLVTLTTIFLGIIGGIASILFYFDRESLKNNLTQLKVEYSESLKRAEKIASLEVQKIKTEVKSIAQDEVTIEIERLFRENEVTSQIQSKVRSEIRNNANNLIETQIRNSMLSNNERLRESIKIGDAAIKMRIAHKSGLVELNKYSNNSKFLDNRSLALELYDRIINDYHSIHYSNKDEEAPTLENIAKYFKYMKITNDSLVVSSLVKYINRESNLNDVSMAIYILNLHENVNFKPFEFDLINEWHKGTLKK